MATATSSELTPRSTNTKQYNNNENEKQEKCSLAITKELQHNAPIYTPNPTRPRSVFTSHSFNGDQAHLSNGLNDPAIISSSISNNYRSATVTDYGSGKPYDSGADNMPWRSRVKASAPVLNYYPDDSLPYENWRDHDIVEPGAGGAVATPHGTISLRLHDRIRVDMTLDRAVRVVNFKNNIVLSVSSTGSASALLHPNGRVYQYGSRVEILAHDSHRHNNKYAKMWYKGVSFTSDQCALVYLVDSAGTRTTTDTFSDLSQDFSLSIFYNESRHGPGFVQEALNVLQGAQYWITEDGTENWIINNVRISQTADGLVRIGRNSNKFSLRTSPANGSASVSTPYVHCTGSLGQTSHLFVRRGERRMHYDGASFIVRNAGHSAGFDDKHQLKVY